MGAKYDIRIVRTKERLKSALLELLKEKRLDDISISEICAKASVNRNTFYSHYQSLKDLQSEIEGQFMETIISRIHVSSDTIDSVSDILRQLLECVAANAELCSLLFSENGDKGYLKNILFFALPSAVNNWSEELHISIEDATLLYYYVIGGSINVIELWIENGFKESPQDLSEKLNGLILHGQSAFSNNHSAV